MAILKQVDAGVSATVGIGKDLVALLRDTFLMVLAALLILWPSTFNTILTNAGFEEGSLVGFKWRTGFAETRTQLEQANIALENLKQANAELTRQLAEAKIFVSDDTLKAQIVSTEKSNAKITERSSALQSSVQATIVQTASLANTLPTKLQPVWAVIFSSDSTLDEAKYETNKAKSKAGIQNVRIFFRNPYYASVVRASDPIQAQDLLNNVKAYRSDAHLVDLNSWCPKQVDKTDYIACS